MASQSQPQSQPKHARRRATPTAAQKNRAAQAAARKPKSGGARGKTTRTIQPGGPTRKPVQTREPITPREAGRKGIGAASAVTERRSYSGRHMLTAELLIGILIVAIRAVADYEPQADGTIRGKVGHPQGQYGPLPVLAGLIVTFFLLSFLAASGGLKAKLAVIAGGIIDLALLLRSSGEFTKVSGTWGEFGKAKTLPGDWQTGGDIAGQPITGTLPSSNGNGGQGGPGSSGPPPNTYIDLPKDGKCPAGYFRLGDKCVSDSTRTQQPLT